jgi:hypothetical protein
MNKIWGILIVVICVAAVYLAMAVVMPAINEISGVAAVSLNASANMSNLPGTLEVVESSGWWLWAIPGIAGIIAMVVILRRKV